MEPDFTSWAFDKRRSREERYGAELLINEALSEWRQRHEVPHHSDFHEVRQFKKERSLNPAYEPAYSREDAERVAEVLPSFNRLSISCSDDRPLRDLAFLQFCPALEEFSARETEIRDWTALRWISEVGKLHIYDSVARDLRPVAQLAKVRELELYIETPWPELGTLEQLTELVEFEFHGNILVLQSIPRLVRLRKARFIRGMRFGVPLRRVADLPEMPELRRFVLDAVCDLQGIERSPLLLNLEVSGFYEELSALTSLRQLTHLTLSGGTCSTLSPLAQLPELRRLVIQREQPQDCTPMADAPRLHEVEVEQCPVQLAELAALNAVLPSWDEEFSVVPRPLKPLRLVVMGKGANPEEDPAAEARDWGDNEGMESSESHWFGRQLHRRLRALLGESWPCEGRRNSFATASSFICISKMEHIDRLREIIQCIREVIASTRYPQCCTVSVDSLDEYEHALRGSRDEEEFDVESEREEWESWRQRQRESREYLEREYRYRLRQEQGLPVRPQDFSPPKPKTESEEADSDGDWVDSGDDDDSETHLQVYAIVSESVVYVYEHDRGMAEWLLDMKAER